MDLFIFFLNISHLWKRKSIIEHCDVVTISRWLVGRRKKIKSLKCREIETAKPEIFVCHDNNERHNNRQQNSHFTFTPLPRARVVVL